MAKKGKLIGIGVGPGDTELLTLKAAKVLESVPVIFSPKSAKEKKSIALSIVTPILEKSVSELKQATADALKKIVAKLEEEDKKTK